MSRIKSNKAIRDKLFEAIDILKQDLEDHSFLSQDDLEAVELLNEYSHLIEQLNEIAFKISD